MSQDVWKQTLNLIKKEVNKESFDTWFTPTTLYKVQENRLLISVPNIFFANWLNDNYSLIIYNCLKNVCPHEIKLEFVVTDNQPFNGIGNHNESEKVNLNTPRNDSPKTIPKTIQNDSKKHNLNPLYTFGNFVVGASNQFAHAASRAVSEQPGRSYNPLFIYGGVGLGKTHLLHAIGHFVRTYSPEANICYTSSEAFMNELINAIRYKHTFKFRNKYRKVDVLLIDDIQFFAGKESTQEEFFHTFNSLYDANKQIVITSDCPPKEIPTLEERLRSRFEWGLIADIQPPQLETKMAIIQKKLEKESITIPDDICLLIASNVISNIRELEGCLNKVIAFAAIKQKKLTVKMAQEALKDILIEREKFITIEKIQNVVADYFNIKVSDMKSKNRTHSLAFPRQIAMYLCRKQTNHSLPKIGKSFGGKDHTTILHAYKKIEKKIQEDNVFKNTVNHLINLVQRP